MRMHSRDKAVAAVLAAVAALAVPFMAMPALGVGASKDSVTAGGRALGAPPGTQFAIQADSGPAGQNADGHVKLDNPNGINVQDTRGNVVCLNVQGNKATIEFQIEKSNDPSEVGQYRQVFLEDNGVPNKVGMPDAITATLPRDDSRGCAISMIPAQPIMRGNIRIEDAQP